MLKSLGDCLSAPLSVREELLTRARNLQRYPFESATMREAGRLAASHLREAARDLHRRALESVHDDETCPANATHEVFYVQLAEDGTAIRKWSRSPFEGARKCRVELTAQPQEPSS